MRIWSLQDDPKRQRQFAEAVANGETRAAIAEVFGISVESVTDWKRRPEIKALVSTIQEEKAQRVLSHTDTAILARLEQKPEDIPTETLLRIRQTFAGTIIRDERPDAGDAMADLIKAAHDDPELAEKLRGLGALVGED